MIVNVNARRRITRAARLGTRPAPVSADYEDAARTVDAVCAYHQGWTSSEEPFAVIVRETWADRKSP